MEYLQREERDRIFTNSLATIKGFFHLTNRIPVFSDKAEPFDIEEFYPFDLTDDEREGREQERQRSLIKLFQKTSKLGLLPLQMMVEIQETRAYKKYADH